MKPVRTGPQWLGLAAAVAVAGCSVYDNSLLGGTDNMVTPGDGGGTGGASGRDAVSGVGGALDGEGTGGSMGDYCLGAARVTYPPRPTADEVSDAGENDITLTAAMHTVDLGDREPGPTPPTAYRSIGLDLDGFCTTESDLDVGECSLPPWALGSVDGPGGIDNAIGSIIQEIRERIVAFSSENYTQQVQAGGVSVLFKITNYNGQLNDDQVRVETFVAVPFNALDPDAGAPKWDGTDVWNVAGDSVGPGGISDPKYFDDLAYVKDGKLVASLTTSLRLEVAFVVGPPVMLNMELAAAAVVCELRQDPDPEVLRTNTWEADCVLAGRWRTNHLLQQMSQYPDPLNLGGPLCTNSTSYSAIKPIVCRPTDTYAGLPFPGAVCDAMSIGVKFTTKPARIGDVYPLSPPENRCPDEFEPANDSCETLGCAPGRCPDGGAGGTGGGTGGVGGTGGSAGRGGMAGRPASDAGPASADDAGN